MLSYFPFLLQKEGRICYNSVMLSKTNALKKTVFYEMLKLAGRVFIVARYSERVVVGNRGFTEDEKENGIVLVFNSSMNFSWDDEGIASTLVFGTSPERCFIPADDIVAIYSPEMNSRFITSPPPSAETSDKQDKTAIPRGVHEDRTGSNVVKVDFTRRRAPKRTKSAVRDESTRHEP